MSKAEDTIYTDVLTGTVCQSFVDERGVLRSCGHDCVVMFYPWWLVFWTLLLQFIFDTAPFMSYPNPASRHQNISFVEPLLPCDVLTALISKSLILLPSWILLEDLGMYPHRLAPPMTPPLPSLTLWTPTSHR